MQVLATPSSTVNNWILTTETMLVLSTCSGGSDVEDRLGAWSKSIVDYKPIYFSRCNKNTKSKHLHAECGEILSELKEKRS